MAASAAIAPVTLATLVSATSAQAASMRVGGWRAAGLTEHFHLTFPLSPSWDQSAEEEEGGAEDGPPSAEVGVYVTAVGLRGGARCELRLASNATLARHPPTLRGDLLAGPGIGQLALSGDRSRKVLAVERSGAGAGRRWYLGRPDEGRAAAVAVQAAPSSWTPAGYRYIVAAYTITWKTYREPRPAWHARAASATQRERCRNFALARYRTTVLRALEQVHPTKGRVLPGRPRRRYAEPECVLRRCKVLANDSDLVVYRAESRSLYEPSYERTLVASLTRNTTTSLASGGIEGSLLGRFVLSGQKLAFTERWTGRYNEEPTHWSIGRFDAGTGRIERVAAALNGENALRYPSAVSDLVLGTDGTVAWIIGGPRASPKARSVYYLAPGSAMPTQLASSEAVEPRSLAIVPGRLRWSERGVTHEASIA
jgi:hypothetical protein